jgi:hypothetical protein
VKRKGREADRSPPFSVKVKECGAISPLPHMSNGIVLNYTITFWDKFTIPGIFRYARFDVLRAVLVTDETASFWNVMLRMNLGDRSTRYLRNIINYQPNYTVSYRAG